MITATYSPAGSNARKTIYTGTSMTEARRACAAALGYRDLRSAYSYTSTTPEGHEEFFCRRKEASNEDYACACIVETIDDCYISGNTYAIKDTIKRVGGHWDGDRKMWWVGRAKRSQIEAAVANAPVPSPTKPEIYDGEVWGKVTYTSKSGESASYYVRWAGVTSTGKDSVRLTNLAGTIDFWADASAVVWAKRYQMRDGRRGSETLPTLRSIRKFVEDRRAEEKDGRPRTYAAKMAEIQMRDDMDDFEGAAEAAREYGIAY
jgi:hypothetical protein